MLLITERSGKPFWVGSFLARICKREGVEEFQEEIKGKRLWLGLSWASWVSWGSQRKDRCKQSCEHEDQMIFFIF